MFAVESDFKNKYLVRKNTGTPSRITTLVNAVPKAPIYHYINKSDNLGPEPTDLIVNAITEADESKAVYVSHVTSLSIDDEKDKGYFGNKLPDERKLVQEYHKRYRQFTRVYDLDKTLDKNYPMIINYQLLDKLYPIKTRRPDTFKWLEDIYYDAIWRTASSLNTERVQFISIHPPRILKPISYYKEIIKSNRLTDIRKISNREDLILLDLFNYYLNNDEDTIIGKYIDSVKNGVLTIRDDINVFYIATKDLVEWRNEDTPESTKLDWIYGLFEYLITLRPVAEVDTDVSYNDHINSVKEDTIKEVKSSTPEVDVKLSHIADSVLVEADKLLSSGAITESEYKGNLKLATRYQTLPNPLGEGKLIDLLNEPDNITEVPESTVPDMKAVTDKGVLNNKVKRMDELYTSKYLEKHALRNILSLQKEGVIITNIKREVVEDAANKQVFYSVQCKPIKGERATFKIDIPSIKPDGTFKMGGVDYRMNKQRGEEPIVKLSDSAVVLTSAMSKLFVRRGARKANSYPEWLYANLLNLKELNYITDVKVGNVFRFDIPTPDTYSILAMRFKTFKFKDITFHLDYNTRNTLTKLDLDKVEKNGTLVGTVPGGLLLVDEFSTFYTLINNKEVPLGTIEDIIGLDKTKIPKEFSEVTIKGKVVPVGVLLSSWMGIEPFFKYIDVKVVEHEANKRVVADDGVLLKFKDLKVVVYCESKLQELLVNGFTYFKDALKEVNYEDLGVTKNYNHIFASRGISISQYTHYERVERSWIDPITRDLLEGMREPTDIRNLFIRATELLTNKQHVEEHDGAYKINKGYNRINDILYKELMVGVAELNRGSTTAKRKFTINPKAVRMAIAMDAGVSPVAEANPLQVRTEQERITYSGAGGRSSQSMPGRIRKFHKNDMGVISGRYTDNGKAGTILYYSANPNIKGIYGQTDTGAEVTPSNLLSIGANINPFSMKDDPKRSAFADIQTDAWANVVGQRILPCRTGAELTVAQSAGNKFALATTEDGTITKLTDKGMVVTYKSGKTESVKLGRTFGSNAGKTIPHKMITDRKEGYKFKMGEILTWNPYFFERDWIEPTQVALLNGVPSFIALRETVLAYEDGSTQSKAFAEKLGSRVTHVRDILVNFDDNFKLLVKEGDTTESDTSLAHILPPGVEFTEDTTTLDYQSNTSPKAKYDGTIERIEVLYCGDTSEATSGIKSVINKGDKQRREEADFTGEFPKGLIEQPTYIGQNFITRNACLVRIYITHIESFGRGDKMGYMHALKTVSGKIYSTRYHTVNGLDIDGDFSYKGVLARIVESPVYAGICNMMVRQIGLNGVKIYNGDKV